MPATMYTLTRLTRTLMPVRRADSGSSPIAYTCRPQAVFASAAQAIANSIAVTPIPYVIGMPPKGTVTLVEKWSGTVGFGAAAMKQRSVVHLSGNDGRGDFPPDREAVSHLGTPFGCGQSVPA